MNASSRSFQTKLRGWTQRRMARWLARRPCRIDLKRPIVSFCFDDFPQSALLTAGVILKNYGFTGTYYTSFGLMGKETPTGRAFSAADLEEFVRQDHELACHTFDHCDSWDTPPIEFERSIQRNLTAVKEHLPQCTLSGLSYPISYPRPLTKRLTAKHYASARGGGQTFNSGTTDLNHLKAFFLEQSRDDFDTIKRIVDQNIACNGWLIFATHDVCPTPTRFGCTAQLFEETIRHVAASGALVLPVHRALNVVQGRSLENS